MLPRWGAACCALREHRVRVRHPLLDSAVPGGTLEGWRAPVRLRRPAAGGLRTGPCPYGDMSNVRPAKRPAKVGGRYTRNLSSAGSATDSRTVLGHFQASLAGRPPNKAEEKTRTMKCAGCGTRSGWQARRSRRDGGSIASTSSTCGRKAQDKAASLREHRVHLTTTKHATADLGAAKAIKIQNVVKGDDPFQFVHIGAANHGQHF
jgi:hypothetical protein